MSVAVFMVAGFNRIKDLDSTLEHQLGGLTDASKRSQQVYFLLAMGDGLPVPCKPGTFAGLAGLLIFAARHAAIRMNLNDKLAHFHVMDLLSLIFAIIKALIFQGKYQFGDLGTIRENEHMVDDCFTVHTGH